MQRALVFALLFALPAGAYGTECAAGYKHKADFASHTCATQETTAASCNSDCCELNLATCGGLSMSADVVVSCPWGTYAANDDAWKNKAATKATFATACCQPKVSCANTFIATPAGKARKKGTVATTKCPSDPKSCTQGDLCFTNDETTCGGFHAKNTGTNVCAANEAPSTTGDAWKKISGITTDPAKALADFQKKCCTKGLVCKGVVCPAGQKQTAGDTVKCKPKNQYDGAPSADDSAIPGDCNRVGNACCGADTTKCGGYANDLALCGVAGFTAGGKDAGWKAKTNADKLTDGAKRKATCCVAVAKCSQGTAPAGYKAKAGSEALSCKSDVASCSDLKKTTACFEKDVKKCGGLGNIACPYGFINEQAFFTNPDSAGWKKGDKYIPAKAIQEEWMNKPATDATKNTACCTPVAVCSITGTTTPAATATPAAPALKFSQRKTTIEKTSERPWGANMVWLGVGGLVGLSVLMVVQSLRSRVQTVHSDAREVDMLLEDQ